MVAVSPIEASDRLACGPRTISVIQRSPSRRSTSAKMLAEFDQQDFLDARDASVIRNLGLPVVKSGAGREDLDDEDRIRDELISPPRRLAGHREIGDVTRVVPVRPRNACLDLHHAGASRLEGSLDPGAEPRRGEPMRRCWRCHRHLKARQQLVTSIGAVLPMEELRYRHPFERGFAHVRPPDRSLVFTAAVVIRRWPSILGQRIVDSASVKLPNFENT